MPWISPFHQPGHWYRGNLHTHTTQSDGILEPKAAVAWYRERGYDFVALSDHWVYTPGRVVGNDFITLAAAEVQGSQYHLLTLGLTALPPRAWAEQPQQIIDALKAQGALAYLAHPYWTGRPSSETIALDQLNGLEAYNAVCEESKGTGHGRVCWDDCLSAGRRLTGLAVDDSHWHSDWQGIGYVMVRALELSETAILRALQAGDFYSTTGPVIGDMRIVTKHGQDHTLHVHCSPSTDILFYTAGPRGKRVTAQPGTLLTSAQFPLRSEQVFVRVECRDAASGIAWSNPLYMSDVFTN